MNPLHRFLINEAVQTTVVGTCEPVLVEQPRVGAGEVMGGGFTRHLYNSWDGLKTVAVCAEHFLIHTVSGGYFWLLTPVAAESGGYLMGNVMLAKLLNANAFRFADGRSFIAAV